MENLSIRLPGEFGNTFKAFFFIGIHKAKVICSTHEYMVSTLIMTLQLG